MIKKTVVKIIVYFFLFALLALTEKTLGLHGFCIAFLFALFYCREKIYIILPTFIGALLGVNFSILNAIIASVAVFLAVISFVIHYKKHLKYHVFETAVYTLLSLIPLMAFTGGDPFSIAITALSVILSLIFHYPAIVGCYPMLVRGLRYRLNSNEKFALGIILCLLSVGPAAFTPFNIEVFYFAVSLILTLAKNFERKAVTVIGLCLGLGAAFGTGSPQPLATVAVVSLACYATSKLPSPVCAAATVFSFCAFVYFFNGKLDLYAVIPLAVGCIPAMVIPQKVYKKILAARQGYQERFALRTVVNRDREELASKLKSLSSAFNDMQNLLINERPSEDNPESIVRAVCETSCVVCPKLRRCSAAIGDIAQSVRRLVLAALDNGKATLLDASVGLSENCTKLNFLINLTNDSVKEYNKNIERKSGIEQGKEMVIAQLCGTALLLDSLARSVNVNLTFDAEPEKKLIEKLGQANVIATDVCFYSDGEESEVTLVVRESDVDKSCITDIVSETTGCPMLEYSRARDVSDMASLRFARAPVYKVIYGESVSGKENRCGDTRQAVKIGLHKIMFILSDGMGTGKSAHATASRVIKLIETFYRAGFDHKTVFSNVARLLALRDKEDFSALDVCIVDTQNATIDFIKQGGRESYIFSDRACERIDGGTLPMGIIEDSEPVIARRRLKLDSMVILMSDGVADAFNGGELAELIKKTPCLNPQTAADALVNDAIRLSGGKTDDMTVIALRIVRA